RVVFLQAGMPGAMLRAMALILMASAARGAEQEPPPAQEPALDFHLLAEPKPPPKVDEGALRRRRTLLTLHQGAGIGLFAVALAAAHLAIGYFTFAAISTSVGVIVF